MCPERTPQPDARPGWARVFFSLWSPPEAAQRLAAIADSFAAAAGGLATRQESIHLTLAFLGDVAVERLPELERAARGVRGEAFALTVDRLCIWRHNRIFWAGCSVPPPALAELYVSLNAALQAAGFAVADAGRTFTPHVTLARKIVMLDAAWPACEPLTWDNRRFVLVRSTPSANASSYQIIGEFPLPAGVV